MLHESINTVEARRRPLCRLYVTVGLLAVVLVAFALTTPPGLLPKVDMIGFAVCHQIASHSFVVGGSQLPLCARCTGTFLGALVGLVGQLAVLRRGRAGRFPAPAILVVLVSFTVFWAADGVNSYLALLGGPTAYEPTNSIRLISGALNGLTMSTLVYPLFNMSVWRFPGDEPNIRRLGDLGVLLAMEGMLVGLVLSEWPFLLYPLALLSGVAVVALLTSVNAVLAVVLLGRENRATTWRQVVISVVLGLVISLIQVGLIDLIRYQLTGTLGGLPLP